METANKTSPRMEEAAARARVLSDMGLAEFLTSIGAVQAANNAFAVPVDGRIAPVMVEVVAKREADDAETAQDYGNDFEMAKQAAAAKAAEAAAKKAKDVAKKAKAKTNKETT